MKYFEVIISKLSKRAGNKDEYQIYDKEAEKFATLREVKEYLKGNIKFGVDYRGHKRVKMYTDDKDGNSKQIGYIYSWKEKGATQSDYQNTYYEQHWIEVRELKATTVLVKI